MGWTTATIAELVNEAGVFCDGDWIETEDQDPNGDVRLIQLADIGDGYYLNKSNRFLTSKKATELRCTYLATGDVVIARMPDPLGRACIFPGDDKAAVTAVDVCIVRTGTSKIDHRWLKTFINAPQFRAKVAALQSGSTRKRISRKNLATIHLPVPPTNEHIRIAEKVEELFSDLDAGVAALERARANLKRYRAAVLKAAVEGKLTEQWRKEHPDVEPAGKLLERILAERRKKWEEAQLAKYAAAGKTLPKGWKDKYTEPAKPNITSLLELPEGWCWATMEQAGEVQLGRQRSPRNKSKDYPTKYLRAANITELGLDLSDVLEMEFKPNEKQNYLLRDGDLVLSEASGSPSQVGKPAIWRNELDECCFQNTVIRLRSADVNLSTYLLSVLRAYYINGVFAKTATGVGINHLSAYKFAKLPLPLAPVMEQAEVVSQIEAALSTIAYSELGIERSRERADRLRQAILKRAFEGKLVPQDPNDEPASVLLERIRAARTASAPPARNSRGRRIGAA
jgi:type I restriction enzyme S subunit